MIGWLVHRPLFFGAAIGLLVSVVMVAFAVARTPWGREALRITRRFALLIGLTVGLSIAGLILAWHFTVRDLRAERARAISQDTLQRGDVRRIASNVVALQAPSDREIKRQVREQLRACVRDRSCVVLFARLQRRTGLLLLPGARSGGGVQTAPPGSQPRRGGRGTPPTSGGDGGRPPSSSPPPGVPPAPSPGVPPGPFPIPPVPPVELPAPLCDLLRVVVVCP